MDSVYPKLAQARLRSISGSPRLLVLRGIGDAIIVVIEAVAPLILVSRFGSVAGWTGAEVALLIGIARTGEAMAGVLGRGVDPIAFSDTVRRGRFDQVLLRPVSPLGWLLSTEVDLRFVLRALVGVIVVAVAAGSAGVSFTPAHLALLSGSVIASAVLVLSVLVLGAALTFVTVEGSDVANLLANGGIGVVSFPLDLYGGALRFAFTFVVPIGLCVYVPVLTLLDRHGPGVLGPHLLPLLPLTLVAFVTAAAVAWRAGVRRYQSTGS